MSNDVKILEQKELRPRSAKIISGVIEGLVLLMALVLAIVIRVNWLESAVVISGSMKPTLHVGDRLLVDHHKSLQGKWKRGDIVIFSDPPGWPPDVYVKRIIAVPGDVVQISRGHVFINGQEITESYLAAPPYPENYGPWQLAPDQYFVMGDNRNDSEDSRDHGAVQGRDIHGRVISRLWPLSKFGRVD